MRLGETDPSLRLCAKRLRVFWGDREFPAKPKEYALIELLMRHPGRTLSRQAIATDLYGLDSAHAAEAGNVVAIIVARLAQRFEAFAGQPLPISACGEGYRCTQVPRPVSGPAVLSNHDPAPAAGASAPPA